MRNIRDRSRVWILAAATAALVAAPVGAGASASNEDTGFVGGVVYDEVGQPVPGVDIEIPNGVASTVTDESGAYTMRVATGEHVVIADSPWFEAASREVEVTADERTKADFNLTPLPRWTLSGVVRDGGEHEWPVYAEITVAGIDRVVFTDPLSGEFSVDVPEGRHQVVIESVYDGYNHTLTTVDVHSDVSLDAQVHVGEDCSAPGYEPGPDGDCSTVAGGILVGYVHADGEDDHLNDARIEDLVTGDVTTSGPTPYDPALGDGFYALFSSHTGPHLFEVDAPGFVVKEIEADVVEGEVDWYDFWLG